MKDQNNTITISLSSEIMGNINKGNLKTKDLISFILANVPNVTTEKEIVNTALKDLCFHDYDNRYPISGVFDTLKNVLILTF